jgi:single-strand DNA-binding protein
MASFNKVILVGHLGKDPELRYVGQGNAVCNFSVATTEKRKNRNGDMEEVTTWFKVTAWGRQAELCNEYLAKGRQAYIEGRVTLETYTDREGQSRSSLAVNATDVKFLGDIRGGSAEGRQESPTRRVGRQEVAQAIQEVDESDPVPF